MADVILFRPTEVYSEAMSSHRAPLGLLYLASEIAARGFSVKIIDTETTKNWEEALGSAMEETTLLAGVGVMTGYQIRGAIDFATAVKRISKVPVVWGGLHPSLLPEETLRHEAVDIVVIGEGEATLADLVEAMKNHVSPDGVCNILYKRNGEIIHTQRTERFLEMDKLRLPDYRLVDVEYYANQKRSYMGERERCLDLNTDRGCPNRCGFCYNLRYNSRRWRGMSAEKVLDAVTDMVNRYRIDTINFTSDNFFVNKERVRAVAAGLIERKLNVVWQADMRIDTFLQYDDALLSLIKRSGCAELTFGVESGSDKILQLICKDIRVADVLRAHDRALDFGFRVNYHFMIGFPDETAADIKATAGLIYSLSKKEGVTLFGPAIYTPYPGTPLFDRSVQLGFRQPKSLEEWTTYDFHSLPKFPWFTWRYKRYLTEVQYVTSRAITWHDNMDRRGRKKYYRLRLFGISHGVSLLGLDILLMQICRRILRAMVPFLKHASS